MIPAKIHEFLVKWLGEHYKTTLIGLGACVLPILMDLQAGKHLSISQIILGLSIAALGKFSSDAK